MATNSTARPQRRAYLANGGAALDLYAPARRAPQLPELPEERSARPAPQRRVRVKAKVAVAPVTVGGFAAVLVMLVLVVFGYVQLYEASSRNAALADELAQLQTAHETYVNQYEGQIDLSHIEDMAMQELGMHKTLADQSVYVDLSSATDGGVVLAAEDEPGLLRRAFDTVRDSLSSLLEYLS